MPIVVGKPSERRLAGLLDGARRAEPTYAEVGATRSTLPAGYRHDRYAAELGGGDGFDRAADGLRRWAAHRGAGVRVVPAEAPVAPGETVLVVVPLGPVTVVAPCRIVDLVDERDRFGFAYGTLPGHPERGEEAFHVVREGGVARFEITVFSKPAHPLARLAGPVARHVQRTVTLRYLEAVRGYG